MTRRAELLLLALLVWTAVPSQAAAFEPQDDATTTLTPTFVWTDDSRFSEYRVFFREPGAGFVFHTAIVAADDPADCPGDGLCTLTAAAAGYPPLETRDYEWAILAKDSVTGQFEWWEPAWASFHPLPDEPTGLIANWIGDQVHLSWSSAEGAATYEADFQHDLFVPATASFPCTSPTCSGSENVAHIPYGTIHVKLRSCGLNGRCTKQGAGANVVRACPAGPSAPVIIGPKEGSTIGGLVPVQFSHVAYGERFSIGLIDNGSGTAVVSEDVEYGQLVCEQASCTRIYPLPVGSYTANVSASCANTTSAAASVTFNVDGSNSTPELVAPKDGQTTSIFPLVAWKKVLNVDRYEVKLTEAATGAIIKRVVDCVAPHVCAFDARQAGLPPLTGTHTATVRVAMALMPYAPTVTFHPTYAYVPPAPTILTPATGTDIGAASNVGISFSFDPQIPFVSTEIHGPSGFSDDSGRIFRDSPSCTLIGKASPSFICSQTTPLAQFGHHTVAVHSWSFADDVGGTTSKSAGSDFVRPLTFAGSGKATYSIYAQNMQFLPSSPLNGGASNGYFHSDSSRADALADYILTNEFDVVALSEVFTMEAKRQLNKRLSGTYSGISHIDTAGRWDEVTVGSIAGGYLAGWWLGAAGAGAAFGWYKSVEDWSDEANSGLALYSKFKIKEYPNKGWDENSRCTDDLFNEIDETHPDFEPGNFKINDRAWFRQYCHGAGTDDMSAKGLAAVELENPVTGVPLLIFWSHTQAYTAGTTFFELSSGDYSESYEDRATQVEDNASPAVRHLLDEMGSDPFDAFILGDWNIPSPASVGAVPQKLSGNDQKDGWADTSLMYKGPPTTGEPRNPTLKSLVGNDAPSGDVTLFDQYWQYFDPRNTDRPFPRFHDLWLENPAGSPGFTFDPAANKVAKCHEVGEPCWGRTAIDQGARYDQVLARFHASLIPLAENGNGVYPGNGHPAWGEGRACVQHVRLAKDFGLSDHWGTIIEVGPDAPYCGPNRAKADPHLWRAPPNAPAPQPPKDKTFDAAAGRHEGVFEYGGANEWFYFSEPGGFDVIVVDKDPLIKGLRIDAYDARDLSTMIPVADAEQKTNQTLVEACPDALESIRANGFTPLECATSEKRITYRSPNSFFMRIRPAHENGEVCNTCTGDYEVIFRKRTCKVYWEAVPVAHGIPNDIDQGWFGEGQPRCWFSYELAKPTLESDAQTLTIADLKAAIDAHCPQGAPGGCSSSYQVRFFDAAPPDDHKSPPPEPAEEIHPPETFAVGTGDKAIVTSSDWFKPKGVMSGGVMPETGRRKLYALVERDNPATGHAAVFPWQTNLMSVTYHSLSVFDIEDDIEIEIEICLPLIGCIIDEPKDPFETEDEISAQIWTNGAPEESLRIDDFGVDYAGGKGAQYPNVAPGGLPEGCKAYQRCKQPQVPETAKGTTINYTQHSYSQVFELDSPTANDPVVRDPEMCGVSGTAPYFTWQATRFKDLWNAVRAGGPEESHAFEFSDDCPDDDPQFRYRLQVWVPRMQ